MTMMKKTVVKIPGSFCPPKNEIDGILADLHSKSLPELLELRNRQLKLLNNIMFINKLPDKGYKIQTLYNKIEMEIKSKQEEEYTCQLFNKINLNNNETVENIEWEGKITSHNNTYLDSDDDSEPEDVLNIISQNTLGEKIIKVLKPEKLLITPENLVKIEEIPHVKYIVEKTRDIIDKPTGQFKPYKTTKTDVHKPEKEMQRKKHKYWEITSATPPSIVHGPTKVLTIEESLRLQQEYNMQLKKIEAQHAAEKLLARAAAKMPEVPENTYKFGDYRSNIGSDDSGTESDPESSDKEVHDEEPERGGVIFTVMK